MGKLGPSWTERMDPGDMGTGLVGDGEGERGRRRATSRSPKWRTQELDVLTQRGSRGWQVVLFVSINQGVGGMV